MSPKKPGKAPAVAAPAAAPTPEASKARFRQALMDMVRAGYPGIIVPTREPKRAQSLIQQTAEQLRPEPYGVRVWSLTEAWKVTTKEKNAEDPSQSKEPVDGLLWVRQGRERAFYVLHAFDEFFGPEFKQAIRDVFAHAKTKHKTVVLVGDLVLPKDIAPEFATVPLDLPEREELTVLAKSLHNSLDMEVPPDAALRHVVDAAVGLTLQEAENAFSLSFIQRGNLDPAVVYEAKKDVVHRNGILEYVDSTVTMDEIGGWDVAKAWVKTRAAGFTPEARAFGLEPPKGVVLCGVHGTAKSLFAKTLRSEWKLPLLRLDMGRIFGSLVGDSERNMRDALAVLNAVAPVILQIDEFDKAVAGMGAGQSGDGGTTQRVMATFLTWLQERSTLRPIFVVATANELQNVDAALLRRGRWDEIFAVDLPSATERAAIFAVHLKKRSRELLATPANLQALARASVQFTGAEIEQCVKDGLWTAFAERRQLTLEDVVAAAKETKPLAMLKAEQVNAIRKFGKERARFVSTPEREPASDEGPRRLQLDEGVPITA